MNGQDFIRVINQFGLKNVSKSSGEKFDWMFDNPSARPFLQWFCEELRSTNVLSTNELELYEKLESADGGYQVLEGHHLEDALCSWSQFADDSGWSCVSEADVTQLQDELDRCKQHVDELKSMHDRLAIHQTSLADQTAQLSGLGTAVKQGLQHAGEQIQTKSSNVNKSLESVVSAVRELLNEYQLSGCEVETEATDGDGLSVFLSRLGLDKFLSAEEHFTQQLVAFTKKRFFDGIAGIAGPSSDYDMIEVANPDSLLIKGASEDVMLKARKDLTYLHSFYPTSECKWINSVVEEESMAAACSFQESLANRLQNSLYLSDVQNITAKLKTTQADLGACEQLLGRMIATQIPGQIKDVASLQAVKVLRGDYDLKIARQDYFTGNQDEVIEQLTLQRSRSELLTMALELELSSHRHVQRLLTAVALLLQQISTSLRDRMQLMSELERNSTRLTRTTLDSRDTFVHNIHAVLDDTGVEADAKSLFVTYSAVDDKISNLLQQTAAVNDRSAALRQADADTVAELEHQLKQCERGLYADGSAVAGQPLLSPRPVIDAVIQLEGLLNKLELVVSNVMKDIDGRKQVVQKDSLLRTERQLFAYFYTAPDRLHQAVAEAEHRLCPTDG